MKKLHTRKGGFTLIELMIVVAIIGILAAIAIPNFLRFQLKAKSSEGKTNLAAIRTAEQSYYSEFGVFVSANASPANNMQNQKMDFVNEDMTGMGFDQLGWSPEGQVYFNYGVAINMNGYTASAGADIDADSNYPELGLQEAQRHCGRDGEDPGQLGYLQRREPRHPGRRPVRHQLRPERLLGDSRTSSARGGSVPCTGPPHALRSSTPPRTPESTMRSPTMQIHRARRRQGGFTLMELMVTAALVGVLVAIAIPNFLSYQARSRRSEAMTNLAAVGRAQKAYQAERNEYHNSVTSWPNSAMYGGLGTSKMPWDSEAVAEFEDLGWAPEGKVFYSYGTFTPDNAVCGCDLCFTAAAYGDVDGNNSTQLVMYVHPQEVAGSLEACRDGVLNKSGPVTPDTGTPIYDASAPLSNSDY